tara:strand:- start:223 stop:1269 length:1047 start_codon:yes stop_codon:yes gene_type:complete
MGGNMVGSDSNVKLNYQRTIGMTTMDLGGKGFYYPNDTAITPDGKIYVLNRSLEAGGGGRGMRVTICDVKDEFHGDWGTFGPGVGEFMWPSAICLSPDGWVFIADEHLNKIMIFSENGQLLDEFGTPGSENGEIDAPSGLVINNQFEIFVSDTYNDRIQVFSLNGEFIRTIGGSAKLNMPWKISMGPDDHIYVADWANDRICLFSQEGDFLTSYGETGTGNGQFMRPSHVISDEEGYIYVCDWGNERIQVLDSAGAFIQSHLGSADLSPWAEEFLIGNEEEAESRARTNLHKTDIPYVNPGDRHEVSGHIEEYFWAPMSMAIHSDGCLYVTESNRHRIQVFEINTMSS